MEETKISKPIKPNPKDCKGLMDWAFKMHLYKIRLARYEKQKDT